ncbi:MAG TPA: hypothetical protein VK174_11320 [Chitinophagales bacterium]|nr:hypothetical protein [Chitinophagales bacterium]
MKSLGILMLVAIAYIANAQQLKFKPVWQLNKTINLEYTYRDLEEKKGGERKFDTIHADIQMKLLRENEDFYFFSWQFVNYYQDITDNSTAYKKITGPVIAKFITMVPINFKVDKADWEIKIMNKDEIDSLKDIAVKEAAANLPKKDNAESFLSPEAVLALGIDLQMEKKVFGVIDEYFTVYKSEKHKLELNKKKSLNDELSESDKKNVSKLVGSVEGYMLLDDKAPSFYNFQTEMKMDMSNMMNMFAALAKDLDKDKKKKSKKNSETAPVVNTPINTVTAVNIHVSKQDMLVQLYTQTITMDGQDTWIGSNANSIKTLQVKQ